MGGGGATPVVAAAVFATVDWKLRSQAVANSGTPDWGADTPNSPWRGYGDDLRIGAANTDLGAYSIPLDGDLGEVIVFNRALSKADRRVVEEYLARKWAITLEPATP